MSDCNLKELHNNRLIRPDGLHVSVRMSVIIGDQKWWHAAWNFPSSCHWLIEEWSFGMNSVTWPVATPVSVVTLLGFPPHVGGVLYSLKSRFHWPMLMLNWNEPNFVADIVPHLMCPQSHDWGATLRSDWLSWWTLFMIEAEWFVFRKKRTLKALEALIFSGYDWMNSTMLTWMPLEAAFCSLRNTGT